MSKTETKRSRTYLPSVAYDLYWERRRKESRKSFLQLTRERFGVQYSYPKLDYKSREQDIQIKCNNCCVTFTMRVKMHLQSVSGGCPTCSRRRFTKQQFVALARKTHGDDYSYHKSVYTDSLTTLTIQCRTCKTYFDQNPQRHYSGSGCPACNKPYRYSAIAIEWLDYEARKRRIKIEHAENVGEFQIPSTKLRVDGYNRRSKTVFQFHGDNWHGNPKVYPPESRPNPFKKHKTAKELHTQTKAHERTIRKLGYNLVVMWESEWRKQRMKR